MAWAAEGKATARRVAVVTGAGQGLGRAFARALAGAGHAVVLAERDAARAEAVAAELASEGGEALAVPTDVADPASVESMAGRALARFGRLDVLVNNAAIFSTLAMCPFDQIPLDEWEAVLRVNVTGPFLCSRAVLPAMRRGGFGRVVHISSTAVTLGRPDYLHYVASKSALVGMTRSMARELGCDGVTVNAILPGATTTEVERATVTPEQRRQIVARQCIPRPQVPEDLVGTLLFLASDASAFVTGQCLTVDGGATRP